MKNIVFKFLISSFLVIVVSACGGGGSGSSKSNTPLSPSNVSEMPKEAVQTLQDGISGIVGPNSIVDGIVTIKDEFGNILAQTTTDQNSAYKIDALDYTGPLSLALTCQKTSIIKDKSGKLTPCSQFNPMYALVSDYSPKDGSKTVNITPLTTLAYETAQDVFGDFSKNSTEQANEVISKLFPMLNPLEEDPSSDTYDEAITKILNPDFEIPRPEKMIPFLLNHKKDRDASINQQDLQDVKNLVREIREQSHILYNLTPQKALTTPNFDYTYLKTEIVDTIIPIYEYVTTNSINGLLTIQEAKANNQDEIADIFVREDEEMQIIFSKTSNKIYFSNNQQQEQWDYKIISNNGNVWSGVITFTPALNDNSLRNSTISINGELPLAKKSLTKRHQDSIEVDLDAIFSTQGENTDLKIKGFTKIDNRYLQVSEIVFIDNSSFDITFNNNQEKTTVDLSPNFIDIRATNSRHGLDGRLLFSQDNKTITFNGTLVSNLTDSIYEGMIKVSEKNNLQSIETKGNLELINISRKYKISSIGKEDSENFNTLDLDYSYLNKEVHISLTKSIEEDQTTWETNIKDETDTYLHAKLEGKELSGKITKNGKTLGVIFSFYGLPVVVYADGDIALLF